MIRTIFVIYTDHVVKSQTAVSFKRYAFSCDIDYIKIGDLIEDSRYTTKRQVVDIINNTKRFYQGVYLKDIEPIIINGMKLSMFSEQRIKQINNKQMETSRNIKVTIEQAREWYKGGNATLKTLALNAFTEEELKLSLDRINDCVSNDCMTINVPMGTNRAHKTMAELELIAKYFNGDWSKTISNKGYFIGKQAGDECVRMRVLEHNTVRYLGIIYFKNVEDIVKAIELIGEERIREALDI